MNNYLKIFLSCPYNKFMLNGIFIDDSFRTFLEKLHSVCMGVTPHVFSAVMRDQFGAMPLQEYSCRIDCGEMENANLVIAIPEDSMGVAVELGWASAMGKELWVVLNKGQKYSPLVKGITQISKGKIIWYDKDIMSVLPIISNLLNHQYCQ